MLQVGYGSHGSLVVNMQVLDENGLVFCPCWNIVGSILFL